MTTASSGSGGDVESPIGGATLTLAHEPAERIDILNQLMRIAVSGESVAAVFHLIGDQVRKIVAFDRLSIAIHPPGADYVEVYAAAGLEAPPGWLATYRPASDTVSTTARPRIALRDEPFGEVIRRGVPLIRRNLVEDAVYPSERRARGSRPSGP